MDKKKIDRRKFIKNTGAALTGAFFVSPLLGLNKVNGPTPFKSNLPLNSSSLTDLRHVTVVNQDGRFFGWPANNGMWTWDGGKEILVGYTDGPWDDEGGFHRIGHPQLTKLARSIDGGENWKKEDPDNFVGESGEPKPSPGGINFGHSGFALRVAATGYHGTNDPVGRFFITQDRGKTWEGPYRFNKLNEDPNLEGMQITSRTSHLVTGPDSIQIIMTARNPELEHASRLDKPFVAESVDGGETFEFISWVVPWTDNYRAAMPSTVRTRDGKIIVAGRRRNPRDGDQSCWVDCWVSENNGRNWSFLSKVGDTGVHNGNPAGLALLNDGRLACTYANRDHREMRVRFSRDQGATWGEEMAYRNSTVSEDMGYPQLVQNHKGEMVAIYYISREENPQHYIEAAIWTP